MKKNWTWYVTPLLFGIAFSLVALVWSLISINATEGWSLLIARTFIIALLVLSVLYFIVRSYAKRLVEIWLIELVLLMIGFIFLLGLAG